VAAVPRQRRLRTPCTIPRSINNLATAALLGGYMEQKPILDEQSVRRAAAEFDDAAS